MHSALDLSWKLIGQLGGFAVVVAALSAWLSRIWAEKILEKDRQHYREELERLKGTYEAANKSVQAELDKRVHVYRVQFETEFKALSEIWAKITDLRSDMGSIRPFIDHNVEGEDVVEKYRRRLLRFSKTLAELKTLVFKYAPFYPQNIYDKLWELLNLAGREEFMVARACEEGKVPPDWYVKGGEQFNAMLAQADGISLAIRERIQALSFYPQ
jgi:hypothetical protein